MSINNGPTIRALDYLTSSSAAHLLARKYGEYVHYPKYDDTNNSLIGYAADIKELFDEFVYWYPAIHNHMSSFYSNNYEALGFTPSGKMFRAGEAYVTTAPVNFTSSAPWVTSVGSAFTVSFAQSRWLTAKKPYVANFTATITSITGDAVVVTIGSSTYDATKGGSFPYATYFTITLSSTPVIGNKIDVTIYPTATIYPETWSAAYNIAKFTNASTYTLTTETPSYVSAPLAFTMHPGYNVISVDSVGPTFQNSGAIQKKFPCQRITTTAPSANFYPLRSSNRQMVDYLLATFGDPTTYPVKVTSGVTSKFGEYDWIAQAELDKVIFKKFKDCFQTQYTKRYIDMSFADAKSISSFSDPRTMSIQYPKYDTNGKLLNNPKFNAQGKQIGGTYLMKKQPLYDALLMSKRRFINCLINDNTVVKLDLTLSLFKGQAVYSTPVQTLDNSMQRFLVQARGINSQERLFYALIPPSTSNGEVFLYNNVLLGINGGSLVSGQQYFDSVKHGHDGDPGGVNPGIFPSSVPGTLDVASLPPTLYYLNIGGSILTDLVDYTTLPYSAYLSGTFGGPAPSPILLKTDGIYVLWNDNNSITLYWKQTAINTTTYGTPICFYRELSQQQVMTTENIISTLPRAHVYNYQIAIATTSHILVYHAEPTYNLLSVGIVNTLYNFIFDYAIELPADLKTALTIRNLDTGDIFRPSWWTSYTTANNSHPLYNPCPVAVKTDILKMFSLYYNFYITAIDNAGRMRIDPISTTVAHNSYFDKSYKVYQINQLYAGDNRKRAEITCVNPTYNFDLYDAAKFIMYRVIAPANGSASKLQKLSATSVERALPGKSSFTIKKTEGTTRIYFAGGFSKTRHVHESVFWGSGADYRLSCYIAFDNKYIYVKRGSDWLKDGSGNNVYFIITNLYWGGVSVSNPSYNVSILQAGDVAYLFTTQQTAPNTVDALEVPMIVNSITDDDNGNLYLDYGYFMCDEAHLWKINATKFFANQADYSVVDYDYSTTANTYSADYSYAYYDWLFYNTKTGKLYFKIYCGTFRLFEVDISTLVLTYKNNLVSVNRLSPIVYDWSDSNYFHTNLAYDWTIKHELTTAVGVNSYRDDRLSPYQLPQLGNTANAPNASLQVGIVYHDENVVAETKDITSSGLKDVMGGYQQFAEFHKYFLRTPNNYLYDEDDSSGWTSGILTTCGLQIYICTQKTGSTLYNYYKVLDIRVDALTTTLKPRIKYITTTTSPTTYGTFSPTPVIAANQVTLDVTAYQTGIQKWWPASITLDFSFMEDTVVNASPFIIVP